jgi:hypothetical protein
MGNEGNNALNQPPDQLIEVNQPIENNDNENDNKVKSIITVKNTFYLIKETISLKKDAIKNIYYIGFNYDSLINFDCYINFNVKKNKKRKHLKQYQKHELCYIPNPPFSEKEIIIKNLEKGKNKEFLNEEAFFDQDFYENNIIKDKIKDEKEEEQEEKIYDIGIEFVPVLENGLNKENDNEIVFVSLFEIEKKNEELGIRCVLQKLKKHKFWFELKDIYDGSGNNGKCIICYTHFRNTIFLDCRHSCCCQKCAAALSPKDCPLCKNHIKDVICLDNDRSAENSVIDDNQNIPEEIIINDN